MAKKPTKMRVRKAMRAEKRALQPLTMKRINEIAFEVLLKEYQESQEREPKAFFIKMAMYGGKLGIPDNEMQAFCIGIASISKNRELN